MPDAAVRPKHRLEFYELGALFFLQWMALAAWFVPLSLVLKSHRCATIQPYAFATAALAAFVTPLFFGAMADRHVAPARVLRWLALGTAGTMTLCCVALQAGCNQWLVLGLIQLHAFCSTPTTSISSALVMTTVDDPRREFGPIRAMGTIGWMAGCWLISALEADASVIAGFLGALLWAGLAAFTFLLPENAPPDTGELLTWKQRLGLDALALLKQPRHRVMFITTSLLSIPLAAFYPHTPAHLADAGFNHPSAWMSLGQTTEIAAMFALGALLRTGKFKHVILVGLLFALLRYIFCALDEKFWLLVGIVLHGCSYTFVFATAQIYVNERVEPAWRARAQALLSVLNGGVGNLLGYLGTGWWFAACTTAGVTRWTLFWGVLATAVGAVTAHFVMAYRGRDAR
jgi:nucleoside transporter